MMGPLVLLSLLAATEFGVRSFPLENVDAEAVFVSVDANASPEVMVIDHQTVRFYDGAGAAPIRTIVLPDGTSAVDVFDIDHDGRAELLAVHESQVLAFELGSPGPPQELFAVETSLALARPQPFPYVMVVEWESEIAIALPRKTAIELRRLDGTPLTAFPTVGPEAGGVNFGRPLSVRSIEPPQAGGPSALELRVSMIQDVAPRLPGFSERPLRDIATGRPGTLSHAREAAVGDPANWPWFPLQTRGGVDRVLYALEPPEFRDTLIRVQFALPASSPTADEALRYPGALVPYGQSSLPDFNGDGFVDLLLWKAPVPGGSVDSLAKAATGGAWPLTTTVHLFDPARQKFEARPTSPIRHEVSVPWYVTTDQGTPLRNVRFEDINGDGKSDFGCSEMPDSFSLWLYRNGFAQAPDFEATFPAPLQGLDAVYAAPDAPDAMLLFRSPAMIHVLRVTRD